ncbi:hypothetical protein HBI89_023090, partial [Parastagonospora nodorum]
MDICDVIWCVICTWTTSGSLGDLLTVIFAPQYDAMHGVCLQVKVGSEEREVVAGSRSFFIGIRMLCSSGEKAIQ